MTQALYNSIAPFTRHSVPSLPDEHIRSAVRIAFGPSASTVVRTFTLLQASFLPATQLSADEQAVRPLAMQQAQAIAAFRVLEFLLPERLALDRKLAQDGVFPLWSAHATTALRVLHAAVLTYCHRA